MTKLRNHYGISKQTYITKRQSNGGMKLYYWVHPLNVICRFNEILDKYIISKEILGKLENHFFVNVEWVYWINLKAILKCMINQIILCCSKGKTQNVYGLLNHRNGHTNYLDL